MVGIETAVAGGSLSIFRNNSELASMEGDAGVSRAEDLLVNIDRLLTECELTASELNSIVVSNGPGSFTGIRVGIATALGLRSACGIRCVGLSTLEAIAYTATSSKVVSALPMGRDLTCLQSFTDKLPDSDPQLVPQERLGLELSRVGRATVLCHADVYQLVNSVTPQNVEVRNIGSQLASFLCLSSRSVFANDVFKPLFIDRRAFIKI
jgi:tRNA threonylcarbamoyl adenosine modification protein YeaZ